MNWNGPRFDHHSVAIPNLDPLSPQSPHPPQWSSSGGPVGFSLVCLLCGPVHGWFRDADRALAMASAPGPGNSQPCTTSSFSQTSRKTTSGPVGEQRARSHATPSASMNWCATTIQILSSKMRRTPTQTASWLRWEQGIFNFHSLLWQPRWWRICSTKRSFLLHKFCLLFYFISYYFTISFIVSTLTCLCLAPKWNKYSTQPV